MKKAKSEKKRRVKDEVEGGVNGRRREEDEGGSKVEG